MPRLTPIDPARAEGKAKALLDGVQKALGTTPNLLRTLAHSPAALQAYLDLGKSLGGGSLSAEAREAIALTVAGENDCDYCASAHTALGCQLGVAASELAGNLAGRSGEPKLAAALNFARAVVVKRGWMSDADLRHVREAGVSDGEIAEVLAAVAANTFSNYFNHVAGTEIDFPPVKTSHKAAA